MVFDSCGPVAPVDRTPKLLLRVSLNVIPRLLRSLHSIEKIRGMAAVHEPRDARGVERDALYKPRVTLRDEIVARVAREAEPSGSHVLVWEGTGAKEVRP